MEIKTGITKVRVIKADKMDEACRIPDDKRWHIGDEFIVDKVEITPWGIFLHDNDNHNLDYKRAEIIE